MPSIFISHSWADKEFVKHLASELRAQGLSVWIDHTHIKVGQRISRRIMEGIAESDYFLIVISKTSVESNWVKEEIDSAYFEAVSNRDDTILPVLLDSTPLPKELANLKYADFRDRFEDGFKELMRVFDVEEDYIDFLSRAEREKIIIKLLPTTDKWGEMPSQIAAVVEDDSYLHLFEENLNTSKNKQVVYNSVDAIAYLAEYAYDFRVIRNHSSISPLIDLYMNSDDLRLKLKIVEALTSIGSKLCYDFVVGILKDERNEIKAAILTGLWRMSSGNDYSNWSPSLLKTLQKFTTFPIEKCLYFDEDGAEKDFRFWVFRCLSVTTSVSSLPFIENFLESETWTLETLAEAAAAHWHITKTNKYVHILKRVNKQMSYGSSAKVTLEKIEKMAKTSNNKRKSRKS
jgi:hypothetical protein